MGRRILRHTAAIRAYTTHRRTDIHEKINTITKACVEKVWYWGTYDPKALPDTCADRKKMQNIQQSNNMRTRSAFNKVWCHSCLALAFACNLRMMFQS